MWSPFHDASVESNRRKIQRFIVHIMVNWSMIVEGYIVCVCVWGGGGYCLPYITHMVLKCFSLLPCYNQFLVEPNDLLNLTFTVYPKKYAHGFVVLCFVVVMQSFIMNSVFIHIHQGCFAGTGAIVRLPQCQWSKPDGYGKISQCITTTKHSKAITVCIFLGIYCTAQGTVSIQRLSTVHKFAFLWCGLTPVLSLY